MVESPCYVHLDQNEFYVRKQMEECIPILFYVLDLWSPSYSSITII